MISGYTRGVVVNGDGTATYYSSGSGTDLGITDVVAGGGKRDAIAIMTANGDIYSVNGGNAVKVDGPRAENPSCQL